MSEPLRLVPIVEGHGEYEAIPVLLRRIVPVIEPLVIPEIMRPIRENPGLLTRAG